MSESLFQNVVHGAVLDESAMREDHSSHGGERISSSWTSSMLVGFTTEARVAIKPRQVAVSTVDPANSVTKRFFDVFASLLLLAFLAPVFLTLYCLIRCDSRGPAIFKQPRVGLDGEVFTCLKFRTMKHAARDLFADSQTVRNDPRITRVGFWLRRFSLDELPQLINVLNGDMSLVGPRPHAPNTKAAGILFSEASPDYKKRQVIKPGLTGWAQVNGWRGETATLYQLEQRIKHDMFYIAHWSLKFDFYILLLTFRHGFSGPEVF